VVIDVSRQPGQVRRAATALAGCAGSFVFVSSANVYAGHAAPGAGEDAALLPALAGDVMAGMDTYGQAKVACERHVLGGFGAGRSLIARVGLIGGPETPSTARATGRCGSAGRPPGTAASWCPRCPAWPRR
jgi:2'-hydroxyisoflavone reductase